MLNMVAQRFFHLAWSKPQLTMGMLHASGNLKYCGSEDNRVHSRAVIAKQGKCDIFLNTSSK